MMPHRNTFSPLDPLERLVPGRAHVLVGGPGTGKTATSLRFIAAGLAAGERAAMLVVSRGSDVKAHGSRLGVDLDEALRFERLILLRYRADFLERLSRAAQPRQVVDEVERLFAPVQPSRIAIDSFAPLLVDGPAGGVIIAGLATYLERLGVTSLLTYPEDISSGYDRRLEPLLQSAAAIFRLERRTRERVDLHALTIRAAAVDSVPGRAALPS
jgi:KaiC/GvpD/RAD55 family RecA-like ATPase